MQGDTNTQKTKLELNAEDSYLVLNENSIFVKSIVNYAALGGGDIGVKVAGLNKRLHTADSVRDFNIEEQLLKSTDWEAIDNLFSTSLI